MAEYRTVEGEPGAVNVLTNLTTFGAETGVGPIKVPAGSQRLAEFWVGGAVGNDTAGETGSILMRLSGKGMTQGDQDFTIGGAGGGVTSTGSYAEPATIYPIRLIVTPNENINVAVMVTDADVLLGTVSITLVFA
jgi:hypothetical protein